MNAWRLVRAASPVVLPSGARLFIAGVALFCAGAVPAQADGVADASSSKRPVVSDGTQVAQPWLSRMRAAATSYSYQGTMVFTAGGVVASSRVGHYVVGDDAFERVEALDGAGQRSFRHNDFVMSFWPQRQVVTVSRRDAAALSPLGMVPEARFRAHYETRQLGLDRVAGRLTHVLMLSPRDALRFAQRLWIDVESGLMLRADVLGSRGEVLESTSFTDIEIGVRPRAAAVQAAMRETDGWRTVTMQSTPTQLAQEGWRLDELPEGFQLLGCVRKPVTWAEPARDLAEGPGAARPAAPGPSAALTGESTTLQVIYSDGLARVSVFIEPVTPGRQARSLVTQMGATHALLQSRDDRWRLVLMGDVPVATLKRFAAALQRIP